MLAGIRACQRLSPDLYAKVWKITENGIISLLCIATFLSSSHHTLSPAPDHPPHTCHFVPQHSGTPPGRVEENNLQKTSGLHQNTLKLRLTGCFHLRWCIRKQNSERCSWLYQPCVNEHRPLCLIQTGWWSHQMTRSSWWSLRLWDSWQTEGAHC